MVVVCAVVQTGLSAVNTIMIIISVQGANAAQGRKKSRKRGRPTARRSKAPLNMMLYLDRYSVAAHEPSASNMTAEPFVFDAQAYAMAMANGQNGRIDRSSRTFGSPKEERGKRRV